MLRKISICIAALLFVSSVAMATDMGTVLNGSVSQIQQFNIGDSFNNGMASVVALTHGDTGGSVVQALDVQNVQSSPCSATPCFDFCFIGNNSCGVEALQTQIANLDQDAQADGACGIINVNAYLDSAGAQNQFIGASTSPKQQVQNVGLAAQQILTRTDGAGGGNSTNDACLTQTQAGSNAGGSVYQSSLVDALQQGCTGGAANSTTALASTLLATTTQQQQVY